MSGSTRNGIALVVLLGAGAGPLAGQAVLNQFSSEDFRLSAVGVDVGALGGTKILGTTSAAIRFDFGRIAPAIRVLIGVSYFKSDLSGSTLDRFAQRLKNVVIDPSGDDTIRLGSITWSDVTGDVDFQYIMPQGNVATAYMGLGVSVHARHAAGTAVDGTFVQDALGAITAGLNGTLGAEFGRKRWRFSLEGRGVLASGVSTLGLYAGIRYRWVLPSPRAQ
ncbi:MAG TPA: hypothetical protein VLV45_11160 [Gemmatimonadales bacterium]|nr:hypothetical protein [Gemmatimonadales bacterium]